MWILLLAFALFFSAYYSAFWYFRRYLAIKNTPTSKVAALSPGLCEVYGRAASGSPLTLFDGTKCIYYSLSMGTKSNLYEEFASTPFYVRDETGRVLVDASGILQGRERANPAKKMVYFSTNAGEIPKGESARFFRDRGISRRFPIRISYIPVGAMVHVIGDYMGGTLPRPSLPNFTEFKEFFMFYVPGTNLVYPKKLPSGEQPHIGLGKNGLLNVSAKGEAGTLGHSLLRIILGFVFCPIILAPLAITIIASALAYAGIPLPGHGLEIVAITYILFMLPPSYLCLLSFYNSLITLRNNSSKYLANISAYIEKRNALVPQLEQVARAYAKHEKSILENAAGRPMGSKEFMAIAERYPELKADDHYLQVSKSLSEAEEQIARSRELYNDSVTLYNTRIRTFPSFLIAGILGFKTMKLLGGKETGRMSG